MSFSARVASIQAIEKFHGDFCKFEEEAKAALGSIDMEVRRAVSWLKQDRLPFWQGEEKRWRLKLAEAKTQLSRKRISTPHGPPKDSFEKDMVREAEAKLKQAEEKLALIKKWTPVLERAVEEYMGHSRPLGDLLAQHVPQGAARLKNMIQALEAYVSIAPPTTANDLLPPKGAAVSSVSSSSNQDSASTDTNIIGREDQSHEASGHDGGGQSSGADTAHPEGSLGTGPGDLEGPGVGVV